MRRRRFMSMAKPAATRAARPACAGWIVDAGSKPEGVHAYGLPTTFTGNWQNADDTRRHKGPDKVAISGR